MQVNANSIASLVSALCSWAMFGKAVNGSFGLGAVLVCGAVRAYYMEHAALLKYDDELLAPAAGDKLEEGGPQRSLPLTTTRKSGST